MIDFAYHEYKQSKIGATGKVQPMYGSELVLDKVYIDPTDMVNVTSTSMCNQVTSLLAQYLADWPRSQDIIEKFSWI